MSHRPAFLRHLGLALLIPLAVWSAGCAPGRLADVAWQEPGVDKAWPGPPDPPRIRFLRTLSGAGDFRADSKQARLFRWMTGENEQGISFVSPYGVAADGAGRVWVTDTGTGLVHFFDLAGKQVAYWSQAGREPFVSPVGIALDDQRGRIYVSDSVLNKVFVLDKAGGFLGTVGLSGGFSRPAGLAVDAGGRLYVADVLKGRIEVFSPAGEHLASIGSRLAPDGEFNRPANIWVDRGGTLFVVDSFNFRVEMIGPDGDSRGALGAIGDVPGSFARPRGVALDSRGHVYVSDAAFDNVQIFDQQGRLLLHFGRRGQQAGEFNLPAGLFFDDRDRLYVVDSFNRRVQIFQFLDAATTR